MPNDSSSILTKIESGIARLLIRNVPNLRLLRRQISKDIAKWPPRDVVALADEMIETGDETLRYLAYELLESHKQARQSLTKDDLNRLAKTLNSWDSVDTFSLYLSGPAWRDGQITTETVLEWAKSENLWHRRTALVTTVIPSRRGRIEDRDFAIQICELLVDDREDMVVKALSWALRELTKHHREAVEEFLSRYGDRVPARARREVKNKLETGLKNRK